MRFNKPIYIKDFTLITFVVFFCFGASTEICKANWNPSRNDSIFPPTPAAKAYIDFDGKGFIVNGKRTFIASGSIHYPRVPRENWRDILLKLKRCGFNTVETYIFWNYHEGKEGQFDFSSENRDFGAFLDEAKALGLYAIVRIGPYVCSEWENGGFPTWLYFKPDLQIRKNNKPYLEYVDKWFDKMLPIVSSRQIQKGGNVIFVQLENEQPTDKWRHWGTNMDGEYFTHLLDKAHQHDIEVPMFFSGLHHAFNPAPDNPIESANRQSPWTSTELWTTWFDKYGNTGDDLVNSTRHPWRVLAYGGNAFNLYMFYGGTNFGYFSFSNKAVANQYAERGGTSYDFGTLVGQTGETRPLYMNLKKLAYFAASFQGILAGSTNATDQYLDFAKGAAITARTSPEGTIVFLDNGKPTKADNDTTAVLKSGLSVKLSKGEIVGFPMNFTVTPKLKISAAESRVLGIVPHGKITSLVCYGDANESGRIVFERGYSLKSKTIVDAGFKLSSKGQSVLIFKYPSRQIGEVIIQTGKTKLRILVMDKAMADKTWFVDTNEGRQIVVGAPYLDDYRTVAASQSEATVYYPWNEAVPKEIFVFGNDEKKTLRVSSNAASLPKSIALSTFKSSPLASPINPNFNDSSWLSLADGGLPEIGQDTVYTAYAWYRAHLSNATVITSLSFGRIGDRATFYVDGKPMASFDNDIDTKPEIKLDIPKGEHELAVFVAHFGRKKFDGYVGPIHTWDAQKGLRGTVKMNETDELKLKWKMKGVEDPKADQLQWASVSDLSSGAPAYFQSQFALDTLPESGATYRFIPDGLSFGSIWVNGHHVGHYPELIKNCPGIWLPSCWLKKGVNSLMIFDEKGKAPEKVKIELEEAVSRHRAKYIQK